MSIPRALKTYEHIEAYLEFLRVERRLSESAILRHQRELLSIAMWAADEGSRLEALDSAKTDAFVTRFPKGEPTLRDFQRFLLLDRRTVSADGC